MFAPNSPLTERIRIQNERLLAEQGATSFTLPKVNIAPLRKLFNVHRSVMIHHPQKPVDVCS